MSAEVEGEISPPNTINENYFKRSRSTVHSVLTRHGLKRE